MVLTTIGAPGSGNSRTAIPPSNGTLSTPGLSSMRLLSARAMSTAFAMTRMTLRSLTASCASDRCTNLVKACREILQCTKLARFSVPGPSATAVQQMTLAPPNSSFSHRLRNVEPASLAEHRRDIDDRRAWNRHQPGYEPFLTFDRAGYMGAHRRIELRLDRRGEIVETGEHHGHHALGVPVFGRVADEWSDARNRVHRRSKFSLVTSAHRADVRPVE